MLPFRRSRGQAGAPVARFHFGAASDSEPAAPVVAVMQEAVHIDGHHFPTSTQLDRPLKLSPHSRCRDGPSPRSRRRADLVGALRTGDLRRKWVGGRVRC